MPYFKTSLLDKDFLSLRRCVRHTKLPAKHIPIKIESHSDGKLFSQLPIFDDHVKKGNVKTVPVINRHHSNKDFIWSINHPTA
jgi:hypothetical protein